MEQENLQHGKASTYNNHKCHCPDCRKAWADYIREGGWVRSHQQRVREAKKKRQEVHD